MGIAQKKRLARNTEKIMSHESLARMVKYSDKMIERIAKEVEDNFIARSEPKTLEFKYLMAQEKIDLQREFQKELKLMKETQNMPRHGSDKQAVPSKVEP